MVSFSCFHTKLTYLNNVLLAIAMKIGLIVMCLVSIFCSHFFTEYRIQYLEAVSGRQIECIFFLVSRFCVLKKSLAKNTGRSSKRCRNRKIKIIFIQNKCDLNKNEMWLSCKVCNLQTKRIFFFIFEETDSLIMNGHGHVVFVNHATGTTHFF